MATQIGIIKALIGTATATATDGTSRNLQVGDSVYANELVTTGAGGAVELEFADGSVMDLGRDSQALLDNAVFNPEAVAENSATVESDADAIQAAILAGADPTQVTEATAAGAGTQADGNEGHQPVVVDYLAPQVTPESGFDTTGIAVEFPVIEEELQAPIEEGPIVSVSVQVEVQIDPENPDSQPPTDGIPTPEYPLVVTPEGVFILEGTSQVGESSEPGTRVVAFTLTLDKVYTQDVQVTYTFRPVGADNGANTYGDDWFDGDGPITVTIPAGTLTFPVYVNIVEDSIVEENGQFEIVLIDAVNATINPDASSVMVTIVDDDAFTTNVSISTSDITENDQGITFTATLTTPGDTDVTVATTQGNILIAAGETSGFIFVESYDPDVYIDPDSFTAEITDVTGGEFDQVNIVSGIATANIADVNDVVTVVLTATATTGEDGGSIVYTASLVDANSDPVTSNNAITVTLADQTQITIAANASSGDSAPVAVNRDDVYLETDSIGNSISSVVEDNAGTDGAFENLGFDPEATVSTTITDDSDVVTVVLTATATTGEDGGSIVYTASLVDANSDPVTSNNAITVTLADQTQITIAANASSGDSAPVAVNRDDVYLETDSIGNSISSVVEDNVGTDGAFENLGFDGSAVTTTITDDSDVVTATLTSSTSEIFEDGGTITYTVTLSGAPGAIDPDTDLVFELANGKIVTVKAGETAGSVDHVYTDAQITNQISIDNAFASPAVTSGGSEYESLVTTGTTSVDVDYGVLITDLTPKAQGGDLIVDEDDLLISRGSGESAGSDTTKESTTQQGTFTVVAGDGIDSLTVGGHAVITGGTFAATSFTTALGNTLAITGFDGSTVTYTYTLNDNELSTLGVNDDQDSIFEDFAVVLKDSDTPIADEATGTLSIQIVDDVPHAALNFVNPNQTVEVLSENADSATVISFDLTSIGSIEGADGANSVFSLTIDGVGSGDGGFDTGLKAVTGIVGGESIYLYTTTDPKVMEAKTSQAGTVIFSITLSATADSLTVTVPTMAIYHDATADPSQDLTAYMSESLILKAVHTVTDNDGDISVAEVDLSGMIGFTDGAPTLSFDNIATVNVAGSYEGTYDLGAGVDGAVLDGVTWDNLPDGYTFVEGPAGVYTAADSEGDTFFTLTVNNDGTYVYELVNPSQVTTTTTDSLLQGITGGSNLASYTFDSAAFGGMFDLVATAENDTLTISSTDLGVGDNVMQFGDVLQFAVQKTPEGTASDVSIDTMNFTLSGTGGIKSTDIVRFEVTYADGTIVNSSTVMGPKLGSGNTAHYDILVDIDDNKDATNITLAGDRGVSFKIVGIDLDYATKEFPDDYLLEFNATATDGDGDVVSTSFVVDVDTDDTGTFSVVGTQQNDSLYGSTDDDILTGGGGNDILTGGTGDDTFVWNLGDQGTSISPAVDTILDFSAGDKLDLSDLLQGEETGTLSDYLDMSFDNVSGNTTINVDHDPANSSGVTQQILVNGDLTVGGTLSIENLITNGTIVVDQ